MLRVEHVLVLWIILCSQGTSQSKNPVPVKATINQPVSLVCVLNTPQHVKLTHLSWNRCSTEDQCRSDWDKHRIAHITDMTKVYVDHPDRYKLDTNGTLTIKEVVPEDDNELFFCRGMIPFGKVENITILEIRTEKPKIKTRNPSENVVIEGMPLMLEFEVHGYPYPLVTLRHNQDVVLQGTNVDPMYIRHNTSKMYNGDYTCIAENPLGNASLTIKVNVIDHINTEGCPSCVLWTALSGLFVLFGAILFTNRNKVWGWVKLCLPITPQNGDDWPDLPTSPDIKEDNSHSGDTIKSPVKREGTNSSSWGPQVLQADSL